MVHSSAWLENDGTGLSSPGAGDAPVEQDATFADIDRDGDLDVLNASYIASGLQQHLAWRTLASLGKKLTMDLYGPATGSYLLLASAARLPAPVRTAWGGFSLDPTTLLEVSSGFLDADGQRGEAG